ncbi:MAG: hypothetical protein ACLPJH_01230 [Myxococcaceae bacterium]
MSQLSGGLLVPSVGERGDNPSHQRSGDDKNGRSQDQDATLLEPAASHRANSLKSVGGS